MAIVFITIGEIVSRPRTAIAIRAVLEKAFALSGFQTLLVLDPAGQVRMRHVGFIGSEDLEGVLMRTIGEVTPR